MDLRPIAQPPTESEQRAVDDLLGPAPLPDLPIDLQDAKSRRTRLLPALHMLRRRIGWISPGGLGYVCRRLGVPPAEGFSVASFYALFPLKPRPATFAHVCDDIACKLAGADQLCDQVGALLGPSETSPHRADGAAAHASDSEPESKSVGWARSPCLGLCEQAPAALVTFADDLPDEMSLGQVSISTLEAGLRGDWDEPLPPGIGGEGPRRLLARVGTVNPQSLSDYQAHGGFHALRRALEMGPERVIQEVTAAKLVGRGGAAFPTGRKWDAVFKAPAKPHYVVCNADESEPGTFKDRVLMEWDPFSIIEAMAIAGLATGSEKGYLYLRGEYPLAHERLSHALSEARRQGILGASVMGSGPGFEIEIRLGAGAYICGEETALFNSIEGFRGEPRNKPPFPVQSGLFGKPTSVNNVETLAAVLHIIGESAASYASVGTPDSPGTKLFCLSGAVANPGVYEVPFGTELGRLIELAGGVAPGKKIGAILMGGAAGTFIGADQLSLPLSFEATRKAGVSLGSGVVMVIDEKVELAPLLRRIAAFFRDESCGQCVPCRVGTVRQEELLSRLARGQPLGSTEKELALLKELGQAMRDASICGLGQTASSAIESALARLKPFALPSTSLGTSGKPGAAR